MGTVADELNCLRKGRGVMAADLHERVGPTLRALSGISDSASHDEIRSRLTAYLGDLASKLPDDLSLALSAGLALDEKVRHRFLDGRMQWLADRLDRDVRTARRRVDEAIRSVEALAVTPADDGHGYAPDGWYLARFRALFRADGAQPAAIEERTIVSAADGLSELLISTSIPRAQPTGSQDHSLDFAVLYGGLLVRQERLSATYFRYFIRLPSPLARGDEHQVGVALTIPAGQSVNPRYSFQPIRRCDEFDLRVRFGSGPHDLLIWNLDGVPRGMAADYADPARLIRPDSSGEIHVRYRCLRIGFAYGVRWE